MCLELMSPIEIIEYIKWRQKFYEKNGTVNLMITETDRGFFLCKPRKHETLVHQYLYEQYGEESLSEDKFYFELSSKHLLLFPYFLILVFP